MPAKKAKRHAKKSVDAGKDIKLGPVQTCGVCGFTYEGEAPDKCPVCNSPKETFKTFA
jgi:rubrerythrin